IISGFRGIFKLDQYQSDWTFEFGVPPNPIWVESTATPPWTVLDVEGDEWGPCEADRPDPPDVWKGQIVHEQGTARFPFRTLAGAVARAEVRTPNTRGQPDPRRAGVGWTVLIAPGRYREAVRIDMPLTLRSAEPATGAKIGHEPLSAADNGP